MTTTARLIAADAARREQAQPAPVPFAPGERIARHPRSRYSRFVQLTKIVLAGIALVLITMVIVWPQLKPRDGTMQIGTSGTRRDAEQLNMVSPRYTGIDDNKLPYEVTADLASQASPKAETILLDNPKADMTMKDGTWLALSARSGAYGQKSQQLTLSGDVNLFHDSGYELSSPSAVIDLSRGAGHGEEPTSGHGPAGQIEGEGFRFTDKGKTIVFTGKSHLVLFPNAADPARGESKTSPPGKPR